MGCSRRRLGNGLSCASHLLLNERLHVYRHLSVFKLLEFLTGDMGSAFDLDAPAGMTSTEVHLARMEELLGPFPLAFQDRCDKRSKFFDTRGKLNIIQCDSWTCSQALTFLLLQGGF